MSIKVLSALVTKATYSVCRLVSHRRHHRDQDMFFDGKWPRIERYPEDFDTRDDMSPQAANRKRQELGDDL